MRFLKKESIRALLEGACKRASSLASYKENGFLIPSRANFLEGRSDSTIFSKDLAYPKLLNITIIFGNKAQKMIPEIFEGMRGSTTDGIDIVFMDQLFLRKKMLSVENWPKHNKQE